MPSLIKIHLDTTWELQKIRENTARLYLLCFLLQRYQKNKAEPDQCADLPGAQGACGRKVCLQERLLSDRMEGSKNVSQDTKDFAHITDSGCLRNS